MLIVSKNGYLITCTREELFCTGGEKPVSKFLSQKLDVWWRIQDYYDRDRKEMVHTDRLGLQKL